MNPFVIKNSDQEICMSAELRYNRLTIVICERDVDSRQYAGIELNYTDAKALSENLCRLVAGLRMDSETA